MEILQIYPERRWVSASQITSWASDLRADEVASRLWKREGGTFSGSEDAWDAHYKNVMKALPPITLDEAVALLSDSGDHTFSELSRDYENY